MEEKPLGQDLQICLPNGEQIPFGEIDDHIKQFPELEPVGYVGPGIHWPSVAAVGLPLQNRFLCEFDIHAIKKTPVIVPNNEIQRRLCTEIEEIKKFDDEILALFEAAKPIAFKLVPTRPYVKYIIQKHGKLKLPRKLKKAFKHIYLPSVLQNETAIVKCAKFFQIKTFIEGYGIKPDYPHTKWAKKAMSFLEFKFEKI